MKKINHEQFRKLIEVYYKRKTALIGYGSFGLGKSAVVRDTGRAIAEEKKKEFVEWNKLTAEDKQKVFDNSGKYFILMDIRLSEYDSSDIKGLPDFKDNESVVWKIPFWAKLLERKDSDGILFFDEINLAVPLVISSVYKIIYDRVINSSKINDDWLIMGCGNLESDRAYTHQLASPVRDRGGEVELLPPDVDSWCMWAVDNNIDSRILGFVNFKPSSLHNVDFEDNQKFTTERGWERVNTLIRDVKDYETLDLITSSAIGEGIAKEFVAFCKIKDEINMAELIKDFEKLRNITEISVKYFVITALAENYKNKKLDFNKVVKASKVLDDMNNAEFVVLLWRLCNKYDTQRFKKEFLSADKKVDELYTKYSEFLSK